MFDKKKVLRSVSIAMSTVVLVGAGLLSGCAAAPGDNGTPPAVQEDKKEKVMPEFFSLVGENPKPDVLIGFMEKNIASVSVDDAAKMIVELERAQQNYLPKLEEKYGEAAVQESMGKIYNENFDLSKIDDTQDTELKSLLAETRDMGYKVETAEGTFFPILSHEYLKKFTAYASDDIKAYVDIMAVESGKVPAKDAALVISWNEVVERALAQEDYIGKYGSSVKAGAVKELQKRYLTFMLYGLNNTPLFSYEDKTMNKEAREAYQKAVGENEGSELMKLLGDYLELAKKSDYKLTNELDSFRKAAVEGK
ncbi:MAG TPA: hypothetical protein VN580_01920 [Clostridia bacterium]|nr:hypothetical protein [Clostridia bacterium]